MPNPNVGLYAASAATCDRGYYLENGACTLCNPGAAPYYCPGDDNRYSCPTTDTDYEALLGYTYIRGTETSWSAGTSMNYCWSGMHFRDSHGNETLLECPWNGTNYVCNRRLWYRAGPGYYLSTYDFSGAYDYYSNVRECTNAPAHAHYTGAGTPDGPVKTGGATDYNDCPWACDAGYGRVGDTCQPLCGAGVTHVHAGPAAAPLFPTRRTSPSLVVRTGGGVCYGNLAAGRGAGIHVTVNGATYHLE
ncbi:hypothetical protein HDR63_01755 [bacterium]|nr:hypothetical protein [bacterium]